MLFLFLCINFSFAILNTFHTIAETKKHLNFLKKQGKSIGFVPTMGALHPGHLSLLERAKKENELAVASIFVNPLQFNDKKDLEKYPRTLAKDLKMLEKAGCDMVFTPSVEEIYPKTEERTLEAQKFDPGDLDKVMEGSHRPGHFQGVCIVVKKLFDIIEPTRAYFGEKDFQQLAIIKHMVKTLKLPVEIVPCPTVREADGLAMSSRNALLTPEQRKAAPAIYKTLTGAKFTEGTVGQIKKWVASEINKNPHLELEYFEIVNAETLAPVHSIKDAPVLRACIAVKAGSVRLIDNIAF